MIIEISDKDTESLNLMTADDLKEAKEHLEFKIDFIKEQLKYRTDDNQWANRAIIAMLIARKQLKAVKNKLRG